MSCNEDKMVLVEACGRVMERMVVMLCRSSKTWRRLAIAVGVGCGMERGCLGEEDWGWVWVWDKDHV